MFEMIFVGTIVFQKLLFSLIYGEISFKQEVVRQCWSLGLILAGGVSRKYDGIQSEKSARKESKYSAFIL